ncbi:MAG: helix-turn-helix transcriptional regulator [Inconstantimicrobium porci]|uniref:helix-turn-helix domain-containing protein n=1 Tax=Inconstantimicrobium porci TaxID=2652291 RepID=UPI002A91E4B5|nr:helix-turn-helix transcriptional regulator [Inconstantimicrobium porci]MDY5910597.1 helix-turn-helix transcriptional regulator [Inconstantimicrobium porci]
MNSELIERITKLMKDKNILQKDLVNEMKCSKGYISGVCNGTKSPSEKFINSLSKLSGQSVHWILYGKEDGDDIDTLNSVINLYIENELITSVDGITEEIRETLNKVLDAEIQKKLDKKNRHRD